MASRTPPSDVLAAWLASRRWFATKTRRIATVAVDDVIPLATGALVIARVTLDDGALDRYALALGGQADGAAVADALDDPAFCRALLDLVTRGGRADGAAGAIVGQGTGGGVPALPAEAPVRRIGGEQSNSSVTFGDAVILKLFRRLADGVNPEEEMTRFLTERARFPNAPRLYGHLEYRPRAGGATTLAVLQELVPGARDGWEWMLDALTGAPGPGRATAAGAETLGMLHRLGQVTGGLHVALASAPDDPEFAPEPIGRGDLAAWADGVRAQLRAASMASGEASIVATAPAVEAGLEGLLGCWKIRHHGDLHLGQTLRREHDGDVIVIDFEGEPLRPLAERRRKHAAVRDVAGVLRSIAYAAAASQARISSASPDIAAWAEAWETEARRSFVVGYRAATRGACFLPETDEAFARAVAVFELEKAAYEVVYEANNRPGWMAIPLRGVLRAFARLEGPHAAGPA